jgi:hypothetical protein
MTSQQTIRDARLNRDAAIKILPDTLANDSDYLGPAVFTGAGLLVVIAIIAILIA